MADVRLPSRLLPAPALPFARPSARPSCVRTKRFFISYRGHSRDGTEVSGLSISLLFPRGLFSYSRSEFPGEETSALHRLAKNGSISNCFGPLIIVAIDFRSP